MKVYGTVLSFFVAPSAWSACAFMPQSFKPKLLKPLQFSQLNIIVDFFFGGPGAAEPPNSADVARRDTFPFANPANNFRATKSLEKGNRSRASRASTKSNRSRARALKKRKSNARTSGLQDFNSMWDDSNPVMVQGRTIRTWSFPSRDVEAVQVLMKTDGRPLSADVDLWQGPDNNPQKISIYIEDASLRPFTAAIATPKGQNTVAIQNSGQMEFPLAASVATKDFDDLLGAIEDLYEMSIAETVQGGAVKTYSFSPSVRSVHVLLKTSGRPLNARVELLQGPNNNKQVMELYSDNGTERPFLALIATPGLGNVVRIKNIAPLEFPLLAIVEPLIVDTDRRYEDFIAEGGNIRESGLFSNGLPL
uniref:Uncharacterized protein n=2 Tax=Odontella aurita TaxID=265563 RepID=A0A7S4N9N7_9STRA|mmetsp:Transcript_53872/g.161184  ORF Transcript_53872/g.161184 Transcript_53872/m.161184 type:complete len:364 (+) Transcript_53872:156-1247(+)